MTTQQQQLEATRSVSSEPSEAPVRSSDWLGRVIVFAIYSILYEAIIWGIFAYAVFVKDRSGWWVLVAIMCSGAQLKPQHFGIPEAKRPNDKDQATRQGRRKH
ncbi:MAG: hypothetical protein RL088_4258 [Verrucomicrobiota bacterium]|jgi:hypothetical protein